MGSFRGMYKELRRYSAEALIELDFPGYAVGGFRWESRRS